MLFCLSLGLLSAGWSTQVYRVARLQSRLAEAQVLLSVEQHSSFRTGPHRERVEAGESGLEQQQHPLWVLDGPVRSVREPRSGDEVAGLSVPGSVRGFKTVLHRYAFTFWALVGDKTVLLRYACAHDLDGPAYRSGR